MFIGCDKIREVKEILKVLKAQKGRKMEEKTTQLSTPWDIYVNRLEALFKDDDGVYVDFNREEMTVFLRVQGDQKAQAWEYLLPAYVQFGNVTLSIVITPANNEESVAQIVKAAFEGNRAVSRIETIEDGLGQGSTFVVFKPEIIQYKDDNIGDINGVHSTLMQYLVEKVIDPELECPGVFFNTDLV